MGKLLNLFRDMKVAKKLLISFFVILIAAVSDNRGHVLSNC